MAHLSPSRLAVAFLCAVFFLAGADGCASDPDVEGAKLYINNEEYDQAITNLDRAIVNNPENAQAHALRAEVYRLKADRVGSPVERKPLYQEMIPSIDRAVAIDPALGGATGTASITRLNAWAKEMNQGGQLLTSSGDNPDAAQRAVGAFENAVLIQPDSASSYFNLGLAYLVQGNTDAAVAPLSCSVGYTGGLTRYSWDAVASRCRDSQSGQFTENYLCSCQTLTDLDASPEAYRYLGVALLRTQQGSEAVEILEIAVQRYPDDEALRAELLNAYAATDQPDRAVTAYEAMVATNPDDALLRYNYGSTLLQLERYEEAVEQLTVAVRLDPSNANAHYNLGAAYQNQGFQLNQQLAGEDLSDADAIRIRDERDALFEQAVPHLTEARQLTEAAGESAADICNALFQVYTPLGRIPEAEEAAECAGMDMN